MASSRQERRASVRVPTPGRPERRASPRVVAAAVGLLVLVAVGITLAVTLTGKGSGSSSKATSAPASVNADLSVLGGIARHGLVLGNPFARVTLTEYIDTSCPVCQAYVTSTFPAIASQYVRTGKVKVEARIVAFVGPSSARGRELVIAAARQNKAWQMLELLYENQGNETEPWLTDSFARAVAARIPGLSVAQLFRDAASGAVAAEVAKMEGYQKTDGVDATPTFVLTTPDGKRHLLGTGLFSPSAFASTFDRALKA
jgi:protein-disulfide isomerase